MQKHKNFVCLLFFLNISHHTTGVRGLAVLLRSYFESRSKGDIKAEGPTLFAITKKMKSKSHLIGSVTKKQNVESVMDYMDVHHKPKRLCSGKHHYSTSPKHHYSSSPCSLIRIFLFKLTFKFLFDNSNKCGCIWRLQDKILRK